MPIYDTSDDILISGTNGADVIYGYPETATPPTTEVADELYRPLFAAAPKDDQDQLKDHLKNHLFVVSQGGKITAHDLADPQAEPKVFIDIPLSEIDNGDEAGLLGFAFHPDFATNGKCYVNYTERDSREQVIVEYTIDLNDTNSPPASTSRKIMTIDYPDSTSHHRAGWIDFGPDDMLYIATGDGWRIENTQNSNADAAQTLVNTDGSINPLGKILRIDVNGDDFEGDTDRNYRIPDGTDGKPANPTEFQGVDAELPQPSEIWAIGLRNPWRASFGPDGKLYVADVGQNNYEEVNIVEAGKNYGWRDKPIADGPQNSPDYTDPYFYYGRNPQDPISGQSVTGGYFYTGDGALKGKYIFGDFIAGKIFAMDVSGATGQAEEITHLFKDAQGNQIEFGALASFGRDGQGNLYAISYGDGFGQTGKVFRLSDSTPVTDGPDSIVAGAGDDVVYAGAGNDTVHGGADNDYLYGEADNDRLYGDAGADTLEGGTGNDTYFVDGGDKIVEKAGEGTNDLIRALETFVLQAGQEIEQIIADDPNSETALDLTGNGFDQLIIGNRGDNVLAGGGGADDLAGGAGNDTYIVDGNDDIMGEDVTGGTADHVISSATYTLGAFLEHLTLSGDSAINGTGNADDNKIIGNSAANVLDGGGGLDTLQGGGGNDTYILRDPNVVEEDEDEGIDTVESWVEDYQLHDNVENLTLKGTVEFGTGNDLANHITGNAEANTLDGKGGADTLEGGAGADKLIGGAGNDTYIVNQGDDVVELASEGIDTVKASVTYLLDDNVENLTLTSDESIHGVGNDLANLIIGNGAANILDGKAGADILEGGGGNDSYYVDTEDRVVEADSGGKDEIRARGSFTLEGGSAVESIWADDLASDLAINLTGNGFSQIIAGNEKNNVLNGGGGSDALGGFGGDETYIVDGNDVILGEFASTGIDTVQSSASYTLADFIEKLILTGSAALNGTGNGLANEITGNDAANVLDGGSGNDTLRGRGGNDTYVIRDGDVIEEAANAGIDTVQSWMGAYALGANIENVTLMGGALTGTGNGLANVMTGNDGNNVLDGGSGADTLNGNAGNDSLTGDVGSDSLNGNAGDDSLNGGADNDSLTGDLGNDSLVGGAGDDLFNAGDGNDRLIGGLGKDTFTSGKGKDVFVFDDKETSSSKTKADYITDFTGKTGDRIDLKLVDADAKKRGDQKFAFIGKEAFTKAGQVRYEKTKKETFVYLNTDSDKAAEAVIKLKGAIDLSKGWFVL